ncbi:MAG: HlyD family secretion protein [Deltaproteobacteria bacterium]|nr:HlyD family secretion protein [Deltaproteobacteria bacterium]
MEENAPQAASQPSAPEAANSSAGPGHGLNGAASRHRRKLLVVAGVLALLVAVGLVYYLWTRNRVSTDDAYVDGHISPITPRVAGYVVEVLVDDNQEVQPGQTLVRLDPVNYEVAVAGAKATLAAAEATLTSLELGVPLELSQTEQRVRGAKAELASLKENLAAAEEEVRAAAREWERTTALRNLAGLDLERTKALRAKKALAQATLDQANTQFQTAEALERAAEDRKAAAVKKRKALQADLERAAAGIRLAATGEDQATIKSRQVEAQQARVALAKAQLHQAELNLEHTEIKTPIHGWVSKKNVEPGQMVSQGQPLLAVVPLNYDELWITANYKETELTNLKPGQPVDIEVDTYPGLKLKGKVHSIMAGTGAAFSLFPPENATGNFVKVVQRIPVKIVLEQPQGDAPPALRVGMSVIPTIFTNR